MVNACPGGGESASEVGRWLAQARQPAVDDAMAAIYDEAARQIAQQRPLCLASGHCCNFSRFGHDLFVTALETAWFVNHLEPVEAPPATHLPIVTTPTANERTCPWLHGRLCGARAARPLGCRTFYCDPRAAAWSEPLHERLHSRIRDLHDRFGIAYRYGEWLRMLELFGPKPESAAQP